MLAAYGDLAKEHSVGVSFRSMAEGQCAISLSRELWVLYSVRLWYRKPCFVKLQALFLLEVAVKDTLGLSLGYQSLTGLGPVSP